MGRAENYIEGYLYRQAKQYKCRCFKFLSGNDGIPDRILIGYGYTIFIETKAPEKKLRPLQRAVIHDMRDVGANVFVINNRQDIDMLLKYISTHPIKQKLTDKLSTIGIE